jgi:crotonobetaine/carnitine-CoA ligase
VAARAAQQPARRIVRFADSALTYGALDERSNRVARALADLGLRAGDRAALMAHNGPAAVEAWVGLTKAGIVEVPVNTAFRGDILAYQLAQSGARAVIVDAALAERVEAVRARVPALEHVIVTGEPYEALLAAAEPEPPGVAVAPEDLSAILYTSGTTGPSKGAAMTHAANFRLARNTVAVMGYEPGEVLFTAFPLFHLNAKYTTVLAAMLVDGEVVMRDRFSASGFWDDCRAEGVTAFNYMGALLMMLFKQPERPDDADHRVRKAYGAPAPVTIFEDFQRRFGVRLVEVYGSTELGIATANTIGDVRIGSCGRAVDCYEVRVHDAEDRPAAPGAEGEIVVRPREPHVMFEGYHDMPEATLRAFRNLWFHTGDRGRMDADGRLWFVDRMKDAIRRRGENISSWEVEKVLDSHPAVAEAAVVGVPSELTEEEVLAIVVLKDGAALDPAALLDHCQPRLPHFAVPRYVRFAGALPKNPQQRIQKYLLREQGVTPDTWDREAHGYLVLR